MQACLFSGPSAPLEGYEYDARPVIMDTAKLGGAEVADSAGIPSSLVVVPVIIEFP
jgi:hypothetical protein